MGAVAGGGIVTANLGARVAEVLPAYALKGMLGVFMLCIGPAVYFKEEIRARVESNRAVTLKDHTAVEESNLAPGSIAKLAAIGGAVGIFCGVFGVGGGAVTVPAVSFCLPDLPHQTAIGTSLAAMVLPAISGIVRHVQTGTIVFAAALPLIVGGVVGSYLSGRFIALELDEATLRGIFTLVMVVMGGRIFQGALVARRASLQV